MVVLLHAPGLMSDSPRLYSPPLAENRDLATNWVKGLQRVMPL